MTLQSPTQELKSARARLRAVADDLSGAREFGPRIDTTNPPRWEIGHVGWFQEYWCLRGGGNDRIRGSILPNADALYNSATVAHATRWNLDTPTFSAAIDYRESILENTLREIAQESGVVDSYFARLSARHEDMHAEAFHYMRQTWGYEAPVLMSNAHPIGKRERGDVEIAGGAFFQSADSDGDFVFDNERSRHPISVNPFRMSRTPVTNEEYAEFVDSGGYEWAEWWSPAGWEWVQKAGRKAPCYWHKDDRNWMQRRFDVLAPLAFDEPVIHVNAHEAAAYCRFASRLLPSEAEWEYAATWDASRSAKRCYPWGDQSWSTELANLENSTVAPVDAYPEGDSPCGCRQMIGNIWEWTSSTFLPYPGFLRDPYKEYSEPWFGTHSVLRGGCFSTSRRIASSTYRNFYMADRCDVFSGFRTCAP